MRPTEILQSEHRVIEQVLTCLETLADRGLSDGRLDTVSARQAIDFFKTFADGCHHAKEENHLFPLMEARGFARQGGPTGVMLHEHNEGRENIRAMEAALARAETGHADAVIDFVHHAHAYVDLLRQHIFKEDHRLFPMADHAFSAEDQARLQDSFAHVEHHDMVEGTHDKYLELANTLADRFDVPHTRISPCACGHAVH